MCERPCTPVADGMLMSPSRELTFLAALWRRGEVVVVVEEVEGRGAVAGDRRVQVSVQV